MALFGKSTTKKDENKKPSEKAAIKPVKVSKAPKAKKMETKAPIVAKETKKAAKVAKSEVAVATPAVTSSTEKTTHSVILAPHITEKANLQNEKNNVYTFKVAETATKHAVAHAIKNDYKVVPTDVRFVSMPGKTIVYRGRYAFKAGFKKAYVSLKKGDKIDFTV